MNIMQPESIEAHSKILHKENKKSKKKRVSFSIFNADTIEEMESIRKQKERDFFNMINIKNQVNENVQNSYKANVDSIAINNTIISNKSDKENLIRNEVLDNNSVNLKDKLYKKTNIPHEIVKVENIFLNNQNQNNKSGFIPQFNYINTDLNNQTNNLNIIRNEENIINTNTLSVRSPKENILFSNSNLQIPEENETNIEQIKQEDLISNIDNVNDNINNNSVINININEKKDENENEINNSNHFEAISNIYTIFNFSEVFNNILQINEENNFKHLNQRNFIQLLQNIQKELIAQELSLGLKTKRYILQKLYDKFITNMKNQIRRKKYNKYNNDQAIKFIQYRNYNVKYKIFMEFKFYTNKRKDWIDKINQDLRMNLIW